MSTNINPLICYQVTQGNLESVYVVTCFVTAKSEKEALSFAKKLFQERWQTKGSSCVPLFMSMECETKLLGICLKDNQIPTTNSLNHFI